MLLLDTHKHNQMHLVESADTWSYATPRASILLYRWVLYPSACLIWYSYSISSHVQIVCPVGPPCLLHPIVSARKGTLRRLVASCEVQTMLWADSYHEDNDATFNACTVGTNYVVTLRHITQLTYFYCIKCQWFSMLVTSQNGQHGHLTYFHCTVYIRLFILAFYLTVTQSRLSLAEPLPYRWTLLRRNFNFSPSHLSLLLKWFNDVHQLQIDLRIQS